MQPFKSRLIKALLKFFRKIIIDNDDVGVLLNSASLTIKMVQYISEKIKIGLKSWDFLGRSYYGQKRRIN